MKSMMKFFGRYYALVLKSSVGNTGLLLFFVVVSLAELFTDMRGGVATCTFVLAFYMYYTAWWREQAKGGKG
jgi:hypothetical protein